MVPQHPLLPALLRLPHVDTVKIEHLFDCVAAKLGLPAASCTAVSFVGKGSFNHIYRLEFDGRGPVAASVLSIPPEHNVYTPAARVSELATMAFVRASGLYPHVPVPEVYAYDETYDNALGVPFTVREVVEGRVLKYNIEHECPSVADQLKVVGAVARVHAELMRPVPFTQIGCLFFKPDRAGYEVGPIYERVGAAQNIGPSDSLEAHWRARTANYVRDAIRQFCEDEDEDDMELDDPRLIRGGFSGLHDLVAGLIPRFAALPAHLAPLCLIHEDKALRNFVFDPADLSKIVGVLDWMGAYVGPVALAAEYTESLYTDCTDPYEVCPSEEWRAVPWDWKYVPASAYERRRDDGSRCLPAVQQNVGRFHLRKHYARALADAVAKEEWGAALGTVFEDAKMYLKFDEVTFGNGRWSTHRRWLRDTSRRLDKEEDGERNGVIRGPPVYGTRWREDDEQELILKAEQDFWSKAVEAECVPKDDKDGEAVDDDKAEKKTKDKGGKDDNDDKADKIIDVEESSPGAVAE